MSVISRRDLMRGAAALAAGAVAPSALATQDKKPKKVLRIAHITDCHVLPHRNAAAGFAKCLEHLQSHDEMPEVIFNGGDSIFDAVGTEASVVKAQWSLYKRGLEQHCDLQVVSAIGNHDIWGWNRVTAHTTGQEALYGKKWAMDELGLNRPFYSFDNAGWHFIVLDSIQPSLTVAGYIARLDEEQFHWLASDLASTPSTTPIMVMSHAPIISGCAYFREHAEAGGVWHVPPSWMHIDARRIKDLFCKHPNVKLCVSGHEHLAGKVRYLGVSYCSNGAVCGSWWNGPMQETEPGYAIIDLFSDGTFKNTYYNWGWQA